MKHLLIFSFAFFTLSLALSCGAPSKEGGMDKARFALDSCSTDNTGPCTTAANEALDVLTSDSTNVQAALLRSSALATTGGVDMLLLVEDLSKTTDSSQKFKTMHDTIIPTITDITALRTSIATLQSPTYTGTLAEGDDYHRDFYFQIGILQAFEAFTLPTILAQSTPASAVNVNLITSTDKDNIQADFIDADNNLITSGITDSSIKGWDLVKAVRQNYCTLRNITGGPGFTLEVLQDMVLCQLCIGITNTSICAKEAASFVAADFKSPLVLTCASFNFTLCENAGATGL